MAYPPREQTQHQVQRIVQSAAFRHAYALKRLLQFLVANAYERDAKVLKEYRIGVEAFGRPPDFDPKTDPIVRVQIHRLRQKLKNYYETDGRRDPMLIEIPKGQYLPSFETFAVPALDSGPDSMPELVAADSTAPLFKAHANGAHANGDGHQTDRRRAIGTGLRIGSLLARLGAVALVAAAAFWIRSERRQAG